MQQALKDELPSTSTSKIVSRIPSSARGGKAVRIVDSRNGEEK